MDLETEMASPGSPDRAPIRNDLLTVKEVAIILGVHAQTVRRLIVQKKLAAVEVGRLVKIRRSSVADYYRRHVR
jgi:excisionase family DNA binding protein